MSLKKTKKTVAYVTVVSDLFQRKYDKRSGHRAGEARADVSYGEQKPEQQRKDFGELSVYLSSHVLFPCFVWL